MAVQSQKVTDNPNANTYFMVWNLKNTDNIKIWNQGLISEGEKK